MPPINITDVATFTSPVTAPDDGDLADGATFQDPIQDLANRTYYNKLRLDELYGGTVALTEPLIINDFDVTIEEDLTVSGSASVGGALAVTGDITCDDLTVGDDLTVTGTATCEDLTVGDNLTVTDDASVGGDLTVTETAIATFRFRTAIGPDSDTSLTVLTDAQVIHALSLSSDRTYTIDDTGATDGDFFIVRNDDAGSNVILKEPGGVTIKSIANGQSCMAIRVDGDWEQYLEGA